jgi:hypothetical protein
MRKDLAIETIEAEIRSAQREVWLEASRLVLTTGEPTVFAGLIGEAVADVEVHREHPALWRVLLGPLLGHLPPARGHRRIVGGIHVRGSPWSDAMGLNDGVLRDLPKVG